jgi:hypothetical protein
MSKRPVELPNIEDAALRACLAPLAEAIVAGIETVKPFPSDPVRRPSDRQAGPDRQALPERPPGTGRLPARPWRPGPVASSDAPPPSPAASHGTVRTPETLGEWQALAAQEFGIFGMVQQLLRRTDTQLTAAALDFPDQVDGALARLEKLEARLVQQCCAVTALVERLHMAVTQAIEAEAALRSTGRAKHRSNPGR